MAPSGDLFEDAPGPSTQGDQSPIEATPNAGFEVPRDEPAGSSSGSFDSYPFEVWYRDDTRDSVDEDPQAWVDPEVKEMSSLLTRSSALLGMAKAICQRGPWSVHVSPCHPGESVCTVLPTEEKPYFYLYDTPTISWAFVRAFELLCEDLGKAPTLGVFFWFYTVKKTDKVGWMSLCSRPKRKLFKPFLASYKKFKSRFFKVTPGKSGPNLLVDHAGRSFFPLTWTHQPAVSITVHLKDLEDWKDKFAKELNELPLLPSAKIIKGVDYSSRALRELKKKAAQMAEEEEQEAAASAEPIAAAEPSAQRVALDETSNASSLVVLNEPTHSSPIVGGADENSSPKTKERPSKRRHVEKVVVKGVEADKGSRTSNNFQAAKKKFGKLESQNRSCAERAEKAEAEFLNLSKAYAEVEVKINSFRSANAALEEDLQRKITKNKDLARANFELDMAIDSANAEAGELKQKNEGLEASNLDLHTKLALAESSLKQALEDIQSRDQTILQMTKANERTVVKLGADIVRQYEVGFARALEQVCFLHPNIDVSEADPFKEFVDGQLVLVPSPPSSPTSK
ncbi:hypothetical protein CR513_37968, partial [Mucuna pruriens]